jgi:hypothetical protein
MSLQNMVEVREEQNDGKTGSIPVGRPILVVDLQRLAFLLSEAARHQLRLVRLTLKPLAIFRFADRR